MKGMIVMLPLALAGCAQTLDEWALWRRDHPAKS